MNKFDVVLDTDTFNEVDDQFALAYLIANEKKVNIKAVFAAPFFNNKVSSPKEGMELSFNEIIKIFNLCRKSYSNLVFKGADSFLKDSITPVYSDASLKLIELSKSYSESNRLNVICIGAITNLASSLLIDPTIEDRINVVWLGGNEYGFWSAWEFNLQEDVLAANIVFSSKAPVLSFPCGGVVSHFITTLPELNFWLKGKNPICDYLVYFVENYMNNQGLLGKPWSKVIWDVVAVAGFLNPDFVKSKTVKAPFIDENLIYSFNSSCKNINYVYEIDRDLIFADLVNKLTSF